MCGFAGFTTAAADDALLSDFQASEAFTKLATDASANAVGIGVTRAAAVARVALAFANVHLQVDPAPTLGEGPAGSYTLALALHPLVAGSVRAFVDDKEAGTYRVQAGQARTIYVSIPRKGQHQILVGLATQGDTYTTELSYRVDGGASLDKAFI